MRKVGEPRPTRPVGTTEGTDIPSAMGGWTRNPSLPHVDIRELTTEQEEWMLRVAEGIGFRFQVDLDETVTWTDPHGLETSAMNYSNMDLYRTSSGHIHAAVRHGRIHRWCLSNRRVLR